MEVCKVHFEEESQRYYPMVFNKMKGIWEHLCLNHAGNHVFKSDNKQWVMSHFSKEDAELVIDMWKYYKEG